MKEKSSLYKPNQGNLRGAAGATLGQAVPPARSLEARLPGGDSEWPLFTSVHIYSS